MVRFLEKKLYGFKMLKRGDTKGNNSNQQKRYSN